MPFASKQLQLYDNITVYSKYAEVQYVTTCAINMFEKPEKVRGLFASNA